MNKKYPLLLCFGWIFSLGQYSLLAQQSTTANAFTMPWKTAGITQRQAAAHLASRFTFGATPGLVDEMLHTGLEKWFALQLQGKQDDSKLLQLLQGYDALQLSNQQVLTIYPRTAKVLREAMDAGIIDKELADKKASALQLQQYMQQKGYKKEQELYRQFTSQKILRAAYSSNQLHEVLTDFWFNHFNVSATKNDCAQFIPAYERDVIRPNVTGRFASLLLATAQAPAMLFYLDNFSSSGENEAMQAIQQRLQNRQPISTGGADSTEAGLAATIKQRKKNQGLNENYAREIMELHTLGVDGGYTQVDVTEAARILTGWTVYPMDGLPASKAAQKIIERFGEENLIQKGFVHQGDFFFALNRHDTKAKTVMGKKFDAGGGYGEGLALINMLAQHPAAAKFICQKIATRFVQDNPPQTLVNKMAQAFVHSDGDIQAVLRAMVSAPEFWQKSALEDKTKSPFELAISTVRALNAQVTQPFMLYQWISKMGQKMYYYQAPTGFPDKGQYWISTGSLLNRMKFGLAFAAQQIPGVQFNLAALNNYHEPESAMDALQLYSQIMMPERDVSLTIKRLQPLVSNQLLPEKIETAAKQNSTAAASTMEDADEVLTETVTAKNISEEKLAQQMLRKQISKEVPLVLQAGNHSMLARVVGIIIGSPGFQRR
ncbi:MAG: hypothetical protein RL172_740 [Bacteroidota bacterium]|jgi:uncharacterized protein (DUF1800 family)